MAVYTQVSDEELDEFLAGYDVGELVAVKGIAEGVENTNYLLTTDQQNLILTIYEKRVDAADLPFFLNLLRYLHEQGVDCPLPVPNRQGQALNLLAGRPAAMVTFLNGVCARRPKIEQVAQLGTALAKLHLAGKDFPEERANALNLDGWHSVFQSVKNDANEVAPALRELISRELDFLSNHWPENLPSGIIHADLFPDNVFFLKGKLSGLIDFYFACNDMWAYEIAICMNAWCFEPDQSFNATKARALLKAYNELRPLSHEEYEALPVLARGASVRFLVTRLHDWIHTPPDALVKPHDPAEYIRKLRFHQSVSSAGEYGLEPVKS